MWLLRCDDPLEVLVAQAVVRKHHEFRAELDERLATMIAGKMLGG